MSDSRHQQILDRAAALVSPEARARDAAEHERWLDRHADELFDAECDALSAKLKQRRSRLRPDAGAILRRDYHGDQPFLPEPPVAEPEPRTMPASEQRAWDAWVASHIANERTFLSEVFAMALSEERYRVRQESAAAVDHLASRIDGLEGDIAALDERISALEEDGKANGYSG